MKVLIIGGTRFFGIHMVNSLIRKGHDVTIATRGLSSDEFGDKVKRIIFDRSDSDSCDRAFSNITYDVVIDKIAYSSNDIKRISKSISAKRYILMSSTAVYNPLHFDTTESDFNAKTSLEGLTWCERQDVDYGEGKRNVERAALKLFNNVPLVFVRYPFVIGKDDYTHRLEFYVEHILNNKPMNIDNQDNQMSFISSKEAGDFMAYLVDKDFSGAINGANIGTISIKDIINYVENKTGRKAIISDTGDLAPYNGTPAYSVDVTVAKEIGYSFTNNYDWFFSLIDEFIKNY